MNLHTAVSPLTAYQLAAMQYLIDEHTLIVSEKRGIGKRFALEQIEKAFEQGMLEVPERIEAPKVLKLCEADYTDLPEPLPYGAHRHGKHNGQRGGAFGGKRRK